MKKLLSLFLICMMASFVMAQPGSGRPHPNTPNSPGVPPQQPPHVAMQHSVVLMAAHDEEFQVYVDGNIVNKQPQNSVVVRNLSPQPHDIYVVLKRPADKITMIQIKPVAKVDNYQVAYDFRDNMLKVFPMRPQPGQPDQAHQPQHTPQPVAPPVCSPEEAEHMYSLLKKESFDDNRLSLAKQMVSTHNMSALQIKHLAESFTFNNGKVDFLKYAYAYCVDPQNYYECLDVLTFSSDKEEVLKFIQNKR